jgi:superfamily II DNA or RNA helicase
MNELFSALQPIKRRELFEHQVDSIEALRQALREGYRRPILMSPTGSGKTVIALNIIRYALEKRSRRERKHPVAVYFVVPKIDLVGQTARLFKEEGILDVGMLGGGYKQNLDAQVIVTTWQSLMRRKPLEKSDIVLIDEAHSLPEFLRKLMADPDWQDVVFMGLSATPWTKGLGKYFDKLIVGETTQGLIDKGFLSPFRVFAPKSHIKPDLEGVATVAGDYHEGQLSERMQKVELIADAAQTWLASGENRPTICFAVNRAHAMKLEEQFKKVGVKTAYIDMYVEVADRDKIGEQLRDGKVQVVFNVNCLTTGTDWPWVSCLILARPTKSPWTYVQIIGRGLRTFAGKDDCLILDHSDTTVRLGFVTDVYFDELDDGSDKRAKARKKEREEAGEPLPDECLCCGAIKSAKVRKCPACGYEAKPKSDIEFQNGELKEITSGAASKIKADKNTKQLWWSMLLQIAHERGYKQGWAANKYREKFQVWPRGLDDYRIHPNAEVSNWVLSKQIAWAKRREADDAHRRAAA